MDAIYAKPLPTRPSLEQYKKQAKELLKACRAGEPEALRRVGEQRSRAGRVGDPTEASCTLAEAQFTLAREYGFHSWPRFSTHLRGLVDGAVGRFEAAVDAVIGGDLDALESLLDQAPGLVRERSTRTHGATLLHYVAANGVESYRQKTPPNALEIADLLLRRGAEVDATAVMYGYDATTLVMLVSSDHPARAGLQVALVEKLIDFGAAVDGLDGDGEPLLTALAFTYSATAASLVRRGARVETVMAAAGLGREDLVRTFVDEDGSLRPGVRVAGPRAGRIAPTPRANVEWALVFAAAAGHAGVVELLTRPAVDLGARGMAGLTALHWAAAQGHPDVVDLLLKRNAPLEDTANHHHATVLGCAVWGATNNGRSESGTVIERLLRAGADARVVEFPTGNPIVDELLRPHRT